MNARCALFGIPAALVAIVIQTSAARASDEFSPAEQSALKQSSSKA
jgi:hypothetical protein